jgi:hypothetical protein
MKYNLIGAKRRHTNPYANCAVASGGLENSGKYPALLSTLELQQLVAAMVD